MDAPNDANESVSPQPDTDDAEHCRPRKRTRRACDKCSTSRTRCNGECPCRRCEGRTLKFNPVRHMFSYCHNCKLEFLLQPGYHYGYTCRYNREIKKRGRIPTSLATAAQSEAPAQSRPQLVKSPPDAASPMSNGASPNASIGVTQYPGPPPPFHRDSISVVGRAQPSHEGLTSTSPALRSAHPHPSPVTASATTPYLTSSGFAPPHAHFQLSSLLDPSADSRMRTSSNESPPGVPAVSGSDSSAGHPSPANGVLLGQPPGTNSQSHESLVSAAINAHDRGSFSTTAGYEGSLPELQRMNSLYKAPSSECRYRFLDPVLPYLRDIIPASVAADLLDVYLTEPGSSLFRCASPYILTRIFRKKSVLHPTNPRLTTPALLATLLWCAAQTADIVLLHVPGSRSRITNALYNLATYLVSERDPDRWRRIHGGLRVENEQPQSHVPLSAALPATTETNAPAGVVDDVLTFILLSIAVSGGDFKSDCYKWWSKAMRLALALRLNREDERCSASVSPCANPLCSCRRDLEGESLANAEAREERRRVFWLMYCLDRHLGLSFNTVLDLPDSYCEVYTPLPETTWENLDTVPPRDWSRRTIGPPTTITGTGFFEYFLPLMAIMGDIIEVHHRRQHARLGGLDDTQAVAAISDLLSNCERSLDKLSREIDMGDYVSLNSSGPSIKDLVTGVPVPTANPVPPTPNRTRDQSRMQLVTAYSTHILHVLHVLLHGKWDAISMLDDDDDWITSTRFNNCASHAIAASQAVSQILKFDPELTFMPYLFGIYLLHGSFILLLFADRMPQLGPNQSVEQACETIIRAHEVCVVTLSTEFQKNFRKVLRSTLYSVRGSSPTEWEEHRARRRALSLYRWTKGAKGLAL